MRRASLSATALIAVAMAMLPAAAAAATCNASNATELGNALTNSACNPIVVAAGNYSGTFTLNHSATITGAGVGQTTLTGPGAGTATLIISFSAGTVTVEG